MEHGCRLFSSGEFHRALDAFSSERRQAIRPARDLNLGLTLIAIGDFRRGLQHVERSLARQPSADGNVARGVALAGLGRYHDAMCAFIEAATCASASTSSRCAAIANLAAVCAELGDRQTAHRQLQFCLTDVVPGDRKWHALRADLLRMRARLHERAGCRSWALKDLDAAQHLDPASANESAALADRSRILDALGRSGDAFRVAKQAALERPDLSRSHVCFGVQLAKHNRIEQALAQLTIALEIAPHDSTIRSARAQVLTRVGRLADAQRDWNVLAETAIAPAMRTYARRQLQRIQSSGVEH